MIEFQGYKNNKQVFKRSNMFWSDAFELLETKKDIDIDKIDVQLYTDDNKNRVMPVDDASVKTVEEAQHWINKAHENILLRRYKGIRYD